MESDSSLVRLVPVVGGAGVDLQRHRQLHAPACGASSITCLTTGSVFATSSSGTSKISSSCTCSSICAVELRLRRAPAPCGSWRGG